MRKKIPRLTIPGLDAFNKAWAAMCDAVEAAGNIEGSGELAVFQGNHVTQILHQKKEPIDIVLTSAGGSSGSYNFSQIYSAASGSWTTYPSPVTGLAWEYNKTAGLLTVMSPFYTKAKWYNTATGGEWRFQAGICGTGGSSMAFPSWAKPTAPPDPSTTISPLGGIDTPDTTHRPFPF